MAIEFETGDFEIKSKNVEECLNDLVAKVSCKVEKTSLVKLTLIKLIWWFNMIKKLKIVLYKNQSKLKSLNWLISLNF